MINLTIFAILIAAGVAVYLLRKKFAAKSTVISDYSFGSGEALRAKALLEKSTYSELEALIMNVKPEVFTVAVDYLALSMDTDIFTKWLEQGKNKNLAKLFLGAHYLHQAWIARTHARGGAVSDEQAHAFFNFQELSLEQFQTIDETFKWMPEVHSRLIRLSMGMSDMDNVQHYFEQAIATDSKQLWPYVHYCEAIEPKWGGTLADIASLMKRLPKVPIIQHAIELKLILDSLKMNENYFGGNMDELKAKAQTTIVRIDAEITVTPYSSVNRYMVYGYLQVIADFVNDSKLSKKYTKLINGNYALYPYGINPTK